MALEKKTKHIFEAGDLALLMPLAVPVLILRSVSPDDTFAKIHYDHQSMYVETFRLTSRREEDEDC
jgi:hypothetical protein